MDALRAVSRPTLAAATALLIFVALAFGYVLDVTNNESGDSDVVGWLIVSALASVIAAALLMRWRLRGALELLSRVTADRQPPPRRSQRSRSSPRSSSA
jgi:uncharacterized protein HemY